MLDFLTDHSGVILTNVDLATLAHSLEARVPGEMVNHRKKGFSVPAAIRRFRIFRREPTRQEIRLLPLYPGFVG